jgi:hypothetical protein
LSHQVELQIMQQKTSAPDTLHSPQPTNSNQ